MESAFTCTRDQRIVELTARYRLGTNAAYQRVLFQGQSLNAVTKVTSRLCRQGWLRRYPLIPPEDYFTLGPTAVRELGYPARRTEPLGPQALPIDYAVLLYATLGERERQRLTKDDLSQSAPWMPDELTHAPYCQSAHGFLELIRVDLGGAPYHIARKAAADCSARLEYPEFQQLVDTDRFQLVILTATASKARLIRQSIDALSWTPRLRLHLTMIPRLTLLQLHSR